jgi:Mg2+ and Co2+ transporter CorA
MASKSSAGKGGTRRTKESVLIRTDNENRNSESQSTTKKHPDSTNNHPVQNSDPVKGKRISVCIRKRPWTAAEVARDEVDLVSVVSKDEIILRDTVTKVDLTSYDKDTHFKFDHVFDVNSTNKLVYEHTAKPLVKNIFEGGMSTCFAYGQTGTGKTHTMVGGNTEADKKGLFVMAAEDIFRLQQSEYKNLKLEITASFFEIYNGEIFDLLANKTKRVIRENHTKQVKVKRLTDRIVDTLDELLQLIQEGITARTTQWISADYTSSRSHAVLQITLWKQGLGIYSKLSMVDLVGSERREESSLDENTRIEEASINKSLLALTECIRSLGMANPHVPFRGSKLTHILRDSFIGKNSKTCIIAMITPGNHYFRWPLDTLRFVGGVKKQQSKIEKQLEKQRQKLNRILQRYTEQENHEEQRKDRLYREWQDLKRRLQKRHRHQDVKRQIKWEKVRERQQMHQRVGEVKKENAARRRRDNEKPDYELQSMIERYRDNTEFHPLQESDPLKESRILVSIRKRPLNATEVARNEVDVISVPSKDEIVVHERKTNLDLSKHFKNRPFKFDYVFDETASNKLVYNYTAKPLVKHTLEGGMSTCFAYGQTGSGKTYTMAGGNTEADKKGLYVMAAEDLFESFQSGSYNDLELMIMVSFFEIYNGEIFDLLWKKTKRTIREDKRKQVKVVGLTERSVTSVDQLLQLIQEGITARTSQWISADYTSSRSHAVLQITLWKQGLYIHGKLSMVDLAGSERREEESSVDENTRIEDADINKSLLALTECIRTLATANPHVPFRGSKLTHILRDSFTGQNSKTCIIATVNPGKSSYECSRDTLAFVNRVKKQKSKIEEQLEEQRVHLYQLVQRHIQQETAEERRMLRQMQTRQELRERLQKRHKKQLKTALADPRRQRQQAVTE